MYYYLLNINSGIKICGDLINEIGCDSLQGLWLWPSVGVFIAIILPLFVKGLEYCIYNYDSQNK